jgi:hypothetical protein
LLNPSIKWVRKKVPTFIREAVGGAHVLAVSKEDQLIGLFHWQRFQHHRIEQAENGRVRTDSKRERKHGNQRETRFLKEYA